MFHLPFNVECRRRTCKPPPSRRRRFYAGRVMAKILVIDDQPNVRALLDFLLRRKGYDVMLADNGRTGLQLYRQEHPDVILLDLNMPKLDGVTVLKQIRSVDLKQPVIVFTGECTSETEQQVRALGVSGFILKGSPLHLLWGTLKDLSKSSTSATAAQR